MIFSRNMLKIQCGVNVCVCVCARTRVCVRVCVCVRERERERESTGFESLHGVCAFPLVVCVSVHGV